MRELENVYKAKSVLENQLDKIGNVSKFGYDRYWSSTEDSRYSYRAWYVYFDGGYVDYRGSKYSNTCRVRPLLAF